MTATTEAPPRAAPRVRTGHYIVAVAVVIMLAGLLFG
jgi:hypothetical protein